MPIGARQMPYEVTDLWAFVAELDHDSRLALFAHGVALTVNAVRLPCDRRPQAIASADRLAEAVSLDMAGYWRPTAQSYSDASPRYACWKPCGNA
jgi:ParB family transcriptional regulator, chromosome partitioning protein